jgi:hypothetical protein
MKRTPFVIYDFYHEEDEPIIISAICKAFQTQVLKLKEHAYYFEIDMEPFGECTFAHEVLPKGINKQIQKSDHISGFSCHTLVPYGNTTRIRMCKYGCAWEKSLYCLYYDDLRLVTSVSDYLTTDLSEGETMYAKIC